MATTPPQMHLRDLFWLVALVSVVLWAQFGRTVSTGRYTWDINPTTGQSFLLDTATGRCWVRGVDGSWKDTTTPPSQAKQQ